MMSLVDFKNHRVWFVMMALVFLLIEYGVVIGGLWLTFEGKLDISKLPWWISAFILLTCVVCYWSISWFLHFSGVTAFVVIMLASLAVQVFAILTVLYQMLWLPWDETMTFYMLSVVSATIVAGILRIVVAWNRDKFIGWFDSQKG